MKTKTTVSKRTSPKRIGIVVSRFNEFITKRLLEGCIYELSASGIPKKNVSILWVPGAFEIPVTALKLARKKSIHAVICLGAIIRGETIHFELVSQSSAQGITQVALMTGKPVIFGVVATDTVNQAYKRSQDKGDHKGREAAKVAIEMLDTLKSI